MKFPLLLLAGAVSMSVPYAGQAAPETAAGAAPSADIIGIYFDTGAASHCVNLPVGQHHAYLVASRLSAPTGIGGFECWIHFDGPAIIFSYDLLRPGINVYPEPDFGVGFVTPMPFAETMVLLNIHLYLAQTEPAVDFYVWPSSRPSVPGIPIYAVGGSPGDLRPFFQSTGHPNRPVATINGDCAVKATRRTWGGLMALFR